MKIKIILISALFPILCIGQVVTNYETLEDRVVVTLNTGMLCVSPLSENAVRIRFGNDTINQTPELILTSEISVPSFEVADSTSVIEITTSRIKVTIDKQTGALSYSDISGKGFLTEKPGSRVFTPDTIMGYPCFIAGQSFHSPSDEVMLGLGQFQDGHFNLRGISRKLIQVNTQISIPFIYSSKGYGLLWHQYGLTEFNPADNYISLTKEGTTNYTGSFTIPADGEYSIMLDLGGMGNRHYVAIDNVPCIDQSNTWLPPAASALVDLTAGEHQIQVVGNSGSNPKVSWKLNDSATTFRSPNAQALDYVVFYGPSADDVITSYRELSGNVPMLPLWAYGFWQCRERYSSSNQLVETVKEFRKRKIPMDVIVQDWQYWGKYGWGVPKFDEANYPDPSGFIREIHDLNAHFNISIWSNPDKNSEIGQEFVAKDRFIANTNWLDYFNPATRAEYWNTLKTNMFDNGVDSWWMDAVEPENDALKGVITYAGLGDFYRLTYPLMVSKAVYEGQRETTTDKRVCILTRSAFLGQHRYGIINWSGDIGGNWDSYRRQIVAGLNYTVTGLPYWTTDIGGFFRPGSQYTSSDFRELLTRWFQWGALNPVFRIHGYQSETELWKYGETAETNMRKMLDLRYRLIPYIYSEAWQVTKGFTLMRPLVMDFANDGKAMSTRYEFMFGKSFLVAPVTEPSISELDVYLPQSVKWFDFWTGKSFEGGQTVKAAAPLSTIPLFVKAGSIVPMGPKIQFTGQKTDASLEIRVYKGADGEFVLYEDEGDSYNYENGTYSEIPFLYDDVSMQLTIGARSGSFPGMALKREFKIVWVNENYGAGLETPIVCDTLVQYNGDEVVINYDPSFTAPTFHYEAEDAVLNGSAIVADDQLNFSGSGFVKGLNLSSSSGVEFAVDLPRAGNYDVKLRYSAGFGSSRTLLSVVANDMEITEVKCNTTQDLDTWGTKNIIVPLDSGINIIQFNGDSTFLLLDYIDLALPTPVPLFIETSAPCRIRPLNSALYLNNGDEGLILSPKDTATQNQYWKLEPVGYSKYKLISLTDENCIGVDSASIDEGAAIVKELYGSNESQQWILEDFGGIYRLMASHSALIMGVESNQKITQQMDKDLASQRWVLEFITPESDKIVLYEPFDYDLASQVNGLGETGNGWGSAWTVHEGRISNMTINPSLDFTGLITNGNSLKGNLSVGEGLRVYRLLDPGWNDTGSDIWLSFLFQINNPSNVSASWQGISLYNGSDEKILIGKNWGVNRLGIVGYNVGNKESSISAFTGDLVWIVFKMETSGDASNENAYMWINPDPSTEPDVNSADVSQPVNINDGFDRIVCHLGNTAGITCSYDEIRLGHEFNQVTSPGLNIIEQLPIVPDVRIYPTISSGFFFVETNTPNARIEVYDILGEKILNKTTSNYIEKIEMDNPGWYIIRTIVGGQAYIAKVLKQEK